MRWTRDDQNYFKHCSFFCIRFIPRSIPRRLSWNMQFIWITVNTDGLIRCLHLVYFLSAFKCGFPSDDSSPFFFIFYYSLLQICTSIQIKIEQQCHHFFLWLVFSPHIFKIAFGWHSVNVDFSYYFIVAQYITEYTCIYPMSMPEFTAYKIFADL